MVFDVARTLHIGRVGGFALEFREHGGVRLAHNAGQHIEAAAMGHANDNIAHAPGARAFDQGFERWHDALRAFQREALGARIFDVEKTLKAFRLVELAQDFEPVALAEVGPVAAAFHRLLDPSLLRRILDMHELDADMAAIGIAHHRDNVAQRRPLHAEHAIDIYGPVIIGFRKSVGGRIEFGMALVAVARQRIKLGQ